MTFENSQTPVDLSLGDAAPFGFETNAHSLLPPNLEQTPRVVVSYWKAWCSDASCDSQLISACFRANAHSWSDEVDELVQDKLGQVVSSTAVRASGDGELGVASSRKKDFVSTRDLKSIGDRSVARTAIAFTPNDVHACFVLCARREGERSASCEDYVQNASILGPKTATPAASMLLRAASAMVHHPRPTFAAFVLFIAIASALSIVFRRRRGNSKFAQRS